MSSPTCGKMKITLFIFLAIFACYSDASAIGRSAWFKDIDNSVRNNFALSGGHCKVKHTLKYVQSANAFNTLNGTDLVMLIFMPKRHDIKYMSNTPKTFTRVSPEYGFINNTNELASWSTGGNRWTLAPNHPGQDRKMCYNASEASRAAPAQLYEKYKDYAAFYSLQREKVIIHTNGQVGMDCGYFQGEEGCETRFAHVGKWWESCMDALRDAKLQWNDLFTSKELPQNALKHEQLMQNCFGGMAAPRREEKVFVLTSSWDHNYHHFLADLVSRIVHHLAYLREHPQIKIHIREYEKLIKDDKGRPLMSTPKETMKELLEAIHLMRSNVFTLLGISMDRIIAGPVLADAVIIPRAIRCAFPLTNAREMRLLTEEMLIAAGVRPHKFGDVTLLQHNFTALKLIDPIVEPKYVVVMQRFAKDDSKFSGAYREWTTETTQGVVKALEAAFPNHRVIVIADNDPYYMKCLVCMIRIFANADLIVGSHGAGLSNSMFMTPGSVVVEIVGWFDPRMLPVCGYSGTFAALNGIHHYIYYYDWIAGLEDRKRRGDREKLKPLNLIKPEKLAAEVLEFYNFVKQHPK